MSEPVDNGESLWVTGLVDIDPLKIPDVEIDQLTAFSRSDPHVSGSRPHVPLGIPQGTVETRLGDFRDRVHHSNMAESTTRSNDPVPLSECIAEVLEMLIARETRKD